MTSGLIVIRYAWHFYYVLRSVFKVFLGGFCFALPRLTGR
nr:DUF3265 domain-containing protein [Vibrio hangzhouensis]